jgi:hypothetical protein
MGGTALKHLGFEGRRIEKKEYFELVNEIQNIWKRFFYDECNLILHYTNKETYGDIDFVAYDEDKHECIINKLKSAFGCKYISKNSFVYSFDYKGVQIDAAILNTLRKAQYYHLFSNYSPVGNIIGRLIKQKGLKWGIDGLSYPVKLSDSEQLGEIYIRYTGCPYETFEKLLDFLGLEKPYKNSYQNFKPCFDDQTDIFKWLSGSILFNKDIFAFENLNHVNRKRDRLRNDYHNWLEYIKDKPNKFIGENDKSVYIDEVASFFFFFKNDLYALIEERIAKHQMEIFYREKFNGKHLIEWGITDGKIIGECVSGFKQYITGKTNKENIDKFFKQYILLKETGYIKKDFINWYNKNYENVCI